MPLEIQPVKTLLSPYSDCVVSTTGQATRYCNPDGEWNDPNVLDCQEMEFVAISLQASNSVMNNKHVVLYLSI